MNNNIPPVISSFLAYKEVIQNRSPLTVKGYYTDLKGFFKYVKAKRLSLPSGEIDGVDISDIDEQFCESITTDEIYSFLLYLVSEKDNKASIRARKLTAIRSFYKYHCTKSKKFVSNPVRDIESPHVKTALPKYLSLEESIKLLESVPPDSKFYRRDYCILTLFLNCGMRLSELTGINLSDISDDMTKLVVTGKGSKQRMVFLNNACRTALGRYLEVRQQRLTSPIAENDKDALFLSERARRISNRMVQVIVEKHLSLSGLGEKGYSVHKLRHTAATLMYSTGKVDVLVLKDILGHEQLSTTQIYTHISEESLSKAMDESPLANIKSNKKEEKKERDDD